MLLKEICEGFADCASAEIERSVRPDAVVGAVKPSSFEL